MATPRRAMRLGMLLLGGVSWGCSPELDSGSTDLAQADGAAAIGGSQVASGVYLGDDRFLTAWHVCAGPIFDDSLAREDYTTLYNDPGNGKAPTIEGVALDGYYCAVSATTEDIDYAVSDHDSGGCLENRAGIEAPFSFSRINVRGDSDPQMGTLLFMGQAIDLCIVTLNAAPSLKEQLPRLQLELEPVRVGQEVVVAGLNEDSTDNRVHLETCQVTATPTLVLDPDTIQPSPLQVPSFAMDCLNVTHGSSGSPVFDSDTGRVLGIVWTGADIDTDQQRTYVSAVSEWLPSYASRPREEYSRLAELLEDFGETNSAP